MTNNNRKNDSKDDDNKDDDNNDDNNNNRLGRTEGDELRYKRLLFRWRSGNITCLSNDTRLVLTIISAYYCSLDTAACGMHSEKQRRGFLHACTVITASIGQLSGII